MKKRDLTGVMDEFFETPQTAQKTTEKKSSQKMAKSENEENEVVRFSFYVKIEHLEKIRDLAYWDRLSQREVLEMALDNFFKGKKVKKRPLGK